MLNFTHIAAADSSIGDLNYDVMVISDFGFRSVLYSRVQGSKEEERGITHGQRMRNTVVDVLQTLRAGKLIVKLMGGLVGEEEDLPHKMFGLQWPGGSVLSLP